VKLAAIWEFIAGDSRLAPIGVAVAFIVAIVLVRTNAVHGAAVGAIFAAIIALALGAAVFERT
jgi:hypothetical protein